MIRMNKHVIDDARRCLQCKDPSCMKGCPVNTPVKEAIRMFLDSRIEEAGKLLFDNNPLSITCSLICPQENQCEGHCVLGKKGMPVQISAIEQYISDYFLSTYHPRPSLKNRGRVAIVGSGPAGITIAVSLAEKNYDITIFDGNDQIGGILRYGIPEFRLPKSVLDRLKDVMLNAGIKIRPNTTIGASITIEELFRDGYRAVFIGTGTWRPMRLGVKGESLGHVHFAVEYLHNPDVYRLGRTVVIIGAGNVAMDVARTALRHGSKEVYVVSNRDSLSVRAREVEVEYAKIDGVQFEYNKSAVEIVDEGIIFADSRVYTNEDGAEMVAPIAGSEQLFPADSIIIAISQGPRSVVLSSTEGIEVKDDGLIVTDDYGRTTREGIFASGDVVSGAKTVVEAVRASKHVAEAIHQYITEKY